MKRTSVSATYLIADARERAVIPFIETEFKDHAFLVKQVTTADYLICRAFGSGASSAGASSESGASSASSAAPAQAPAQAQGAVVLAAIERKSHEDFAASFKDGRHDNIKKLLALRAATGCKLFYFVEGPLNGLRRIGGIPFENILAAMTMMMVCDGIFVVQTESAAGSAKRLADFVRAFDKQPRDQGQGPFVPEIPDILTAREEETDLQAVVCMWASLGGISVVTGATIARAFTVAELAAQEVTPEQIRELKTDGHGRPVRPSRPINKEAVASLLAVRSGSLELAVKLVSGIRNISPEVARLLLGATSGLAGLCTYAGLDAVKIPQKTRSVKFGKARAERVQRLLRYKEVAGTKEQEEQGQGPEGREAQEGQEGQGPEGQEEQEGPEQPDGSEVSEGPGHSTEPARSVFEPLD
jgi:ERCC4-type nuclease